MPPSASVAALGIRLLSVLVSCRKTPHNRNRLIDTFPPNDWPLLCSQPNRVCPIREDLTMTSFVSFFSFSYCKAVGLKSAIVFSWVSLTEFRRNRLKRRLTGFLLDMRPT